jgi:cytochrome P450
LEGIRVTGLKSIPRAPGWLPLVGHTLPLTRQPYGFIKTLHTTGDLVRVDLGPMPMYFVTNAKLAYEVMVTKARSFHKGRFFDRLRALAGDGLATSDGETHRTHRRLMQPMFHKQRIAAYAEAMSSRAVEMIETWKDGETLQIESVMSDYVVNTLADAMFSTDIGAPAAEAVRRNVPIIIENLLFRTVSPPFLDGMPIPPNRKFDRATKELLRVIDHVVAQAREAAVDGQVDGPDLMSTLLSARDADTNEALSDEEVRDELGTILFAGTETTASTMAWGLYEVATHPEVEAKVLAELDAVAGDRPLTFDDVAELKYLRQVVDETNRLHSVTLLMRRNIEPVELGGIDLPVGTEIAFSLYALHQDPRVFPDAGEFDPDRWLPERAADLPREAFLPFGAGARKCIGDAFSWTEIIIALGTVLREWKLEPVRDHTPKEAPAAMPHPDHMPMTISRRQVREPVTA